MSAFDLLVGTTEGKPYFGFTKLIPGYYEIVNFRLVKNKMYKADSEKPMLKRTLLIELIDQVLFMPEYITRKFEDDESKVQELNTDGMRKFLHFGGKRESNR